MIVGASSVGSASASGTDWGGRRRRNCESARGTGDSLESRLACDSAICSRCRPERPAPLGHQLDTPRQQRPRAQWRRLVFINECGTENPSWCTPVAGTMLSSARHVIERTYALTNSTKYNAREVSLSILPLNEMSHGRCKTIPPAKKDPP